MRVVSSSKAAGAAGRRRPVRGATRVDEIVHALEADIIAGRLAPSERLSEPALARRFRASRTPVREALRYLAWSGLIEMQPRRGAVVAGMPIPRMVQMFEVMAELEGLCARLATRRMTAAERNALLALHDECARAVQAGDSDAYYRMNRRFHEAIYAGAHNPFLKETTSAIRNRVSVYRRYQLRQPGRLAQSLTEHDAVLKAMCAGDGAHAESLMRAHISIQGDLFADFISALPVGGTARAVRRRAS